MLRQIYIILNDNIIYQRNYAKGLDDSLFSNVYLNIKKSAFSKFAEETASYEFFTYKLSYIVEKSLNLIVLFVTGLGDDFKNIKPQLENFKREFLDFYGDNIKNNNSTIIPDVLDPIVDSIHRNLKPKISIVGFSGVGKTTTTKLIKSEEIPMQHIPTITGEVATIKIGKLHFFLWDFAGQDQFNFLWEKFIRGSDAVLLMTDSTLENLEKSRYFFELVNKVIPYARLAVIANKQDLPVAMKIEDIERLMGQKTYSMIAIDPNNRPKMILIIADLLDMDPKVSPLLKPIFERDILMEKAQKALEQGEFNEAVDIFEKISNICLELGDDSLSIELQEKADKLRSFLG
ncbi:MAG: GTP-binding protein [Candidatus Lokiarchaeota archaeon]|nr:GTP-binding protein [Candidatus Lokiarchaeota archaeon]MCK4479835.1 GTP-binding protein [Candidatus Lokiarchaeota archaeon]